MSPAPEPPFRFALEASAPDLGAPPPSLRITGPDPDSGAAKTREYRLSDWEQPSWTALHETLAEDFGTRRPGTVPAGLPAWAPLRPLLTENLTPDILYGYGDPSVLRVERADGPEFFLTFTSNDAPNAFPILASRDLLDWRPVGFVFPEGDAPGWAARAAEVSDFWAAEMHQVGDEFWVCFCARQPDRTLSIGIARSDAPQGPFAPPAEPLLSGGVIDPHLLVEEDGCRLFWKADNNGLWPSQLDALMHERPDLIAALFPDEVDQRTASLAQAAWPWTRRLEPMRRFCAHQALIEATTADLPGFRVRLSRLRGTLAPAAAVDAILETLRTPIYAQRLSPDGRRLIGEPKLILENDQLWEAHLIEGVWVWREQGRYWLFYAGNDFSTPQYGIGVAVADAPTGPYHKAAEPLLRSGEDWLAPGHPSVARAPDGRPRLFLHAYRPGRTGYKAFRALLDTPLTFAGDRVRLG